MNDITHGFSIGIERVNSDIFLSLKAKGTLTHQDYLAITPIIDSALSEVVHPKVNVFIDGFKLLGLEELQATKGTELTRNIFKKDFKLKFKEFIKLSKLYI